MKILLFHPGGNAVFMRQTAKAYYEAGMLEKFYLTFAYQPDKPLGKILKRVMRLSGKDPDKGLSRRKIPEVPDSEIVTHPFYEIARTAGGKILGPIAADFIWERSEHDFGRFVAAKLSKDIGAVHGYEHGSLEVFKRAKELGLKIIYEMPAPFHRTTTEVLENEYRKFPEAKTLYKKYTDRLTPARNKRREEELALADIVICNSSFTAQSLTNAGTDRSKIVQIPYGMPEPYAGHAALAKKDKIVFLYAGSVSVRKGAHYLLDAWRRLGRSQDAELRIFGAVSLPKKLLANLPGNVRISNTLPREELFKEYREAGILIFPTLCDGFGMVLTEALANGCPVLTTRNAGSSDFIKEKENGFIIPPCSPDAILNIMNWCVENPAKLFEMKQNCLKTASSWQWKDYREALIKQVMEKLA